MYGRKDFLIEVADRFEALAFASTDDDFEPITHFSRIEVVLHERI